jgi:hypothetical protein
MGNGGEAGGGRRRRWGKRKAGEAVWRQTRGRIAESTLRVNYFNGTVRMNCGKIAEIPTRRPGVLGTQIRLRALPPGHPPAGKKCLLTRPSLLSSGTRTPHRFASYRVDLSVTSNRVSRLCAARGPRRRRASSRWSRIRRRMTHSGLSFISVRMRVAS